MELWLGLTENALPERIKREREKERKEQGGGGGIRDRGIRGNHEGE